MTQRSTRMLAARRPLQRRAANLVLRLAPHVPPMHRALTWEPTGVLQSYSGSAVARTRRRGRVTLGQQLITVADRTKAATSSDELGFRLLTGASADRGFAALAERHRIAIDAAGLPAGGPRAAALLRPDGFVSWTGDDPASLQQHIVAIEHEREGPRPSVH